MHLMELGRDLDINLQDLVSLGTGPDGYPCVFVSVVLIEVHLKLSGTARAVCRSSGVEDPHQLSVWRIIRRAEMPAIIRLRRLPMHNGARAGAALDGISG
ncbi:hypothetical protein [Rathayibacter tritici]|uniref:hypothetical protein n=1 Tax=Rathayibacter tritici TaxID=33888 RepID=UPI0008333C33|nr:hypothetical protein [Rathayibacter tritici]